MKRILLSFFIILSINSFAQNNRISVQIQTRDCEYLLSISKANNDWYTLDSALIAKGDSIAANTATTNVTISGVYEKVWRDIMKTLRVDVYARAGNTVSRIDNVLSALNISWLNTRLTSDEADITNIWSNNRQLGRKRARKDNDIPTN